MQQPKILVAIRKRPLSKKQVSRGQTDTISVKNEDTVIVSQYKQKVDLTKYLEETIFNFDFAFHQETRNQEVYQQAVRPLVDSAFQGAKVTCFAYGQTGSGKTYTMNGVINEGIPGLYFLGANDIFQYLASPHFRHLKARLSFYEIYCGKLYDLLNKRNELKLRQDNKNNINIIGLQEAHVSSSEQFFEYLIQGSKERITSQNSANPDSSRSHAILQISLKEGKKLFGKISFIDLAGNERGADHMDMGKQTRIDGAQINKSLLSLKQCIRALDQGKGHTPFRGSKLTMVLKDSFVGFCRTVMIGNVSPSSASSQNTINTLRYADRVKQLRKPTQGSSKEQKMAKEMMLPRQKNNAIRIMIDNDDDAEDIAVKRQKAQKQYGVEDVPQPPPKRPMKEDPMARKTSLAGVKNQGLSKPEPKSSSVSKNHMSNNLGVPKTNNLVGQPPQLLNNKGQNLGPNHNQANKRGMVQQPQVQISPNPNLARYNSTQYQKKQQMQVQAPYYLPNNKSANNNPNSNRQYGTGNNNRLQAQQVQPPPTNMSNSQNLSNNYSNISMNSNNSVNLNPNVNNPPYPRGNTRNGNNNYQDNHYQQQPPPQQYNQPNYNQQQQYSQQPPQKNNFFGHQQPQQVQPQQVQPQQQVQYQKNNQNFQQPPPPKVQYQLPDNWQDMAGTVLAPNADPDFKQQILTQMNEHLFTQQQQLIKNHSDSLRREIDIIKSQMSQLNQMQIDRSKISSRGYVQFMQQGIEEKISLLQQLRQKLISFTYKLDTIEQIERKGTKGGHIDDEQLLDDIGY